jgi:hypothetical protein
MLTSTACALCGVWGCLSSQRISVWDSNGYGSAKHQSNGDGGDEFAKVHDEIVLCFVGMFDGLLW